MTAKMMILLSVAVVLSGCTTYYKDAGADSLARPKGVDRVPYYTEYEIGDKIAGDGEATVILFLFQASDGKTCETAASPGASMFKKLSELISPTQKTITNAKGSALYDACEKSGADHILGTTFQYEVTDYFFWSTVKCRVAGFPATATAVKMQTEQPIILNQWQKVEYIKPHEVPDFYPVGGGTQDNASALDSFFAGFVE